MGPVSTDEAIKKFFNNKKVYSDKFKKECGTYCEIDFFQDKEHSYTLQELENLCKGHIDSIENIHKGFLKYLYE